MATELSNEPQLSPETSGRLSDALREIDVSNTNFQLVIPTEVPANLVSQQLLTLKSSELLNYRPPNFMEKLYPNRKLERGVPVIMINAMSGINYSRLLRSVLEGIVSGEETWGNKRRGLNEQFISDYTAACPGSLTDTDTDAVDGGVYLGLIQRALDIKKLEAPVVVVNATNMDKAEVMAEKMPNEDGIRLEFTGEEKKQFLLRTQKDRGEIGRSLKTLHAATGAQVIMVTNQKRSFSSPGGNNGMQVNHDYSTIDLTDK